MIQQLPSGARVDWDSPILRPAPRQDRPHRRETFYPVQCPKCMGWRLLQKTNAQRATVCHTCAARQAGRAGYAVTAEAYGPGFLREWGIEHRRRHPSTLEYVVDAWLRGAGLEDGRDYRREVLIVHHEMTFIVDFMVGDLIIEVNGWNHKLKHRQQRDEMLAAAVGTDRVLFIDGERLKTEPEQVKRELFAHLLPGLPGFFAALARAAAMRLVLAAVTADLPDRRAALAAASGLTLLHNEQMWVMYRAARWEQQQDGFSSLLNPCPAIHPQIYQQQRAIIRRFDTMPLLPPPEDDHRRDGARSVEDTGMDRFGRVTYGMVQHD